MNDAPRHDSHQDEQFDREIDVRRISRFLVLLSLGAIVTCILMYVLYRDFQRREAKVDRPASPLVDRSKPHLPPEPRLQITPEIDLRGYRDEQAALLSTYAWVDEPLGVVRIPIDRAIDLVAAQQLPWRTHGGGVHIGPGGIPAAGGAQGAAAASGAPAAAPVPASTPDAPAPASGGHP